ncbi:Hypothetical predicted protein [Lecanosticta acicola]|uniref:AMP-binding enzyme C-terminal domain-containing protein n=1 Tax=Lecanosticta acicola TaxID=111012 RepID=A0AAI8Z9B1_9PEZI|nr:Hypothetical predicted protein [Lecanosticta acicola]
MYTRAVALALAAVAAVSALAQSSDPVENGPISGPYLPTGTGPGKCTQDFRRRGAEQVIFAYNLVGPGQSAEAFQRLPLRDDCNTFINPNGGPAVPVAIDRTTTYDFALATRQVFSRVTGEYTSFYNGTADTSGTEIIHTNVTLGAGHLVAIPVTFYADVYLSYDEDCLIYKIQAFATIPTDIAGIPIEPPILPQLLALSDLYKGGEVPQKREDTSIPETLLIADRKKDLIKVHGFQVAPAELEGVLLDHSKIQDAGVIGVPATSVASDAGRGSGELPRANLVKKPGVELTDSEVKSYVAERLAKYEHIVGGIVFIGALPKSASGKVLKRLWREQAEVELKAQAKLWSRRFSQWQ